MKSIRKHQIPSDRSAMRRKKIKSAKENKEGNKSKKESKCDKLH